MEENTLFMWREPEGNYSPSVLTGVTNISFLGQCWFPPDPLCVAIPCVVLPGEEVASFPLLSISRTHLPGPLEFCSFLFCAILLSVFEV
jgi:hypothetical protein